MLPAVWSVPSWRLHTGCRGRPRFQSGKGLPVRQTAQILIQQQRGSSVRLAQAGAPMSCVVPQEGIEPPTGGLEGRCSIP